MAMAQESGGGEQDPSLAVLARGTWGSLHVGVLSLLATRPSVTSHTLGLQCDCSQPLLRDALPTVTRVQAEVVAREGRGAGEGGLVLWYPRTCHLFLRCSQPLSSPRGSRPSLGLRACQKGQPVSWTHPPFWAHAQTLLSQLRLSLPRGPSHPAPVLGPRRCG